MKIILASGSPRRRELLEMLGVDFIVCPAKGEEHMTPGMSPEDTVLALSGAKAREVAALFAPEDIVIAADTIVWQDAAPLGKPRSAEDAARMLQSLSGMTHSVYTGVTVTVMGETLREAECTKVRFKKLTPTEIEAYVATGEPMDKAGAYGIQGKASLFAEGIEGDYFNVMGLPLCRLGKMLNKLGVRLL